MLELIFYGLVAALLFFFFVLPVLLSIRVVSEWNRAVVLRLGKMTGVRGPGLILLVPYLDKVYSYVDTRNRTTKLHAEKTLTSDAVSVAVESVAFWHVVDVQKAVFGVEDYETAIQQVSLTCMREMIGSTTLALLLSDREALDAKLRDAIEKRVDKWGIEVISVDILDISIPNEMLEVMSRQAQAERERDARVTLATAEVQIAEQGAKAAKIYAENPIALQLRQMALTYDMAKNGSVIVVPSEMASSLSGGFVGAQMAQKP